MPTNFISNNNQNPTAETTSIQPKTIPSKLEVNKSDTSHKKTIKPTPKENPLPKSNNSFNQGKVYYYQTLAKQKSVEITAWQEDGKRKIYFLNPTGDTTYTIEDIRRSYSYTTELVKFHTGGACALAKISMNPGASMYWYETEITFDENNNPLWKREMQFPQESTAQSLNNKWWWNAKNKTWVKQEIIKEQEVPH